LRVEKSGCKLLCEKFHKRCPAALGPEEIRFPHRIVSAAGARIFGNSSARVQEESDSILVSPASLLDPYEARRRGAPDQTAEGMRAPVTLQTFTALMVKPRSSGPGGSRRIAQTVAKARESKTAHRLPVL